LELIAVGTADANVRVTLYNSDGTVKQAFTDIITAGRQTDIDIRAKVLGDTYGLVEVELLNSANGGVQLQGRMAIYRTRVETGNVLTYDFAYALPLRDTVVGKTFSFSNSVDPQGLNNPVYNWVSPAGWNRRSVSA